MLLIRFLFLGALLVSVAAFGQTDARKSRALYEDGLRAEAAGLTDRAIKAYTGAIDAGADNALVRRQRGKAFYTAKQYQNCIQDLNEAIRLNGTDAESFKLRGDALFQLSESTGAL